MTSLDALLATTAPDPVTAVSLVPGRHQHTWTVCTCGAQRDMEAPRRGRSARRLGGDTERRLAARYGAKKVGQFGDPIDLLGRIFAWQAKATRDAMPGWLAAVDQPVWHTPAPAIVVQSVAAMEPILAGRIPLVVQSFVRQGVPTEDRIWVRATDWRDLHGWTGPTFGWVVMSGDAFLDLNGMDRP